MKDRIAGYLAKGLKAEQVATIVGCSPGYVSQLLKNEDFKLSVEAQMTSGVITEDETLTAKYESAEHVLLKNIALKADEATLPEVSRALDSVSRARDLREKRKNPSLFSTAAGTNVNIQVVSVMLPPHAIEPPKKMVLNNQSEVVAIGDKMLAPMSSNAVKQLFNKITERKEAQNVSLD